MGLFVYTQKGSIISMVVLPTTEIIEPLYQGPGDLFRLEMRTAGKRFSLYQGPVDLFRLEIGKEKVFRSCNQLTISLSTQ